MYLMSELSALSIARNAIQQASVVVDLQFSRNPRRLDAASTFEVEFNLPDEQQKIRLNLQPTRNLILHQTDVQHVGPDGLSNTLVSQGGLPLVYKGETLIRRGEAGRWRKAGWARVMVKPRQGKYLLEGVFSIDGDYHHVALNSNFRTSQLSPDYVLPKIDSPHMIVWKESEVMNDGRMLPRSATNDSLCLSENYSLRQPSFPLDSRFVDKYTHDGLHAHLRRQNGWFDPVDVIGSTDGCPSERLVAMIGVATDCTYTAEFESVNDARENIISQINVASQVYEDTFNIALAIRNLTISDASCPSSSSSANPWNVPCSASVDVSQRLGLFTQWRAQYRDSNAAWTLLTACNSGSTVGIAWIGNTCGSGSSSSRRGREASTNVVVRTNAEWQVIAHELAHNFGANHDCTSGTCSGGTASDCCPLSESTCDAGGQYLMNPSTGRSVRNFSPCTIGSICTAIGRNLIDTSCLVSEADVPDINDSQCGNGIVEAGEACDCGGEEGCPENSCCNPSTCQLRSGAVCDPASDGCCTDQCQIAESGRVCRASTGSGDQQEVCDGSSSQCPADDQDSSDNGDDWSGGADSGGSWLDENRALVIGLSSSIGGLIIALIAVCGIKSYVKRRRRGGRRIQRNNLPGYGPPNYGFVAGGQVPRPPPMVYRYA